MAKDKRYEHDGGATAVFFWFAGWLFTIGFAQLGFGKAVLALLLWPYHLGAVLRAAQ